MANETEYGEGDIVSLKADYPNLGFVKGDKGIIWAIYNLDPPMYEVTFESDVAEAFDMTVYADEIELYKRATRVD